MFAAEWGVDVSSKNVSILFWNVWLDNQQNGGERLEILRTQLATLIEENNPDIVALNEVLRSGDDGEPGLLSTLRSSGYVHSEYAEARPLSEDWHIGCVFASRKRTHRILVQSVGYDIGAHHRGYSGREVKLIRASLDGFDLIVVHLMNITTRRLRTHFQHQQRLIELICQWKLKNVIMVGDFNEPRRMPFSFASRMRAEFENRTGRYRSPTWRHRNSGKNTLRSNLDKVFWTKDGDVELVEFKILDGKVSDHQPLFARFLIN